MRFKKGEICFAKSQDYGNCIIQLGSKITRNVDGELLKSPIWNSYILDSNKDKDLIELRLDLNEERFQTVGFFEDYNDKHFMLKIKDNEVKPK